MSESTLRQYVGIQANEMWPGHAWPGGYTIAYLADDGELICRDCMNREPSIHFDGNADGWRIDGVMAFGADTDYPEFDENCTHCGAMIEEGRAS